ncbi:MAG: DinB family protein [Planctomycetota bacterium]
MTTLELLRHQLETSRDWFLPGARDMADAAMTFPTPQGGNHPTWLIGHLTLAEDQMRAMVTGEPVEAEAYKATMDMGSEPSADASKYPPYDEMLAAWEASRAKTLSLLDTLNEADLDQPPKNVPAEAASMSIFKNVATVLNLIVQHQLGHVGQLSDARRAAGRKPLVA